MIRPYVSEDADRILRIWRKASEFAHPFLSEAFHDMAADAIRDVYLPKAETYVTVLDEAPIGFISLLDSHIGGLFLDPMFLRAGHGQALVAHAVQRKGPLTVEVFKKNTSARRFYEACGFRETGEHLHELAREVSLKMAMKP